MLLYLQQSVIFITTNNNLFQAHNTPAVRPWAAWPSRRRLVPEVSFLYHKT